MFLLNKPECERMNFSPDLAIDVTVSDGIVTWNKFNKICFKQVSELGNKCYYMAGKHSTATILINFQNLDTNVVTRLEQI